MNNHLMFIFVTPNVRTEITIKCSIVLYQHMIWSDDVKSFFLTSDYLFLPFDMKGPFTLRFSVSGIAKGSFTPSDFVTLMGKNGYATHSAHHSVRQKDHRCRPSMLTESFGVNRP